MGHIQITPDIIRSAIDKNDLSYTEFPSIDNLFSAPDKISIPERYIPELVIPPEMEKVMLNRSKLKIYFILLFSNKNLIRSRKLPHPQKPVFRRN